MKGWLNKYKDNTTTKAQKGEKVTVDGWDYDTSDPAYRNIYMFGDHPEGKGSIGYFDKNDILVTSKMTLPEVVVYPKDKATQKFYDETLSDSEKYAFDQLAKKYGPVNISESKGSGLFSGTSGHYNPFTNTITINPLSYSHYFDTYVSELAHKKQFDKQGKFDVIGDWMFNDLPDYLTGKNPYKNPSSVEYEAHSIYEPDLIDEATDYYQDDVFGLNYNKFKSGGWLDKYGKEINANEGHSSAQDNWEGEGYSNVGRNYSPAWGGQFQKGGYIQPTFSDSLNLYNSQIALNKFYENEMKAGRLKKTQTNSYIPLEYNSPAKVKEKNLQFYRNEIKQRDINEEGFFDKEYKKFFNLTPEQIKSLEYKGIGASKSGNEYQAYYRDLITPMQNLASPLAMFDSRIYPQEEIVYTPTEDDKKQMVDGLIKYPGGKVRIFNYDPLAIKPYNLRTPQEKIEWEKKYGKGISKKEQHKSSSKKTIFLKPFIGTLEKPEPSLKKKATKAELLKSNKTNTPGITELQHPDVQIPPIQQGKYRVEYFDPSLKEETHRMFMTQAESDAYADELSKRNLTGVPSAGNITQRVQYAMGGSLPGSVGFTYARTGGIPSNGPYAKKTKASAQDGKTIHPINLHLPKYEAPKPFFTGYGFSQNPVNNVNVYGVGAYGTGNINDRLNLSGNVNSASVFYPGGNKMFMNPRFEVGMKYKFQSGGSMSYYQHGLDWKPKSMENGGWLDKYTPQAQTGDFILPRYDMPRPATSSTAITYNRPRGAVSTSTTGQKKEDVKTSTESMGRVKQREREEEKARVKERQSAKAIKEGKAKTFTFPTGESKSLDQMDAREKAYVTGKSIEGKGRFFENEESIIDDLNPLTWISEAAGALGTSPYEAKVYDSNLPYAGAIGSALFQGALGFDPLGSTINVGKKIGSKLGQSMESGLLSKAHNINPYQWKPKPTSAFRMIGDEKGLASAVESGYLKPSTTGSDIGTVHTNAHYTMGAPSDARKYFGRTWNREYPGPYMAEVPNAINDVRISQGIGGKEMGADVFTFPQNYIPTSEANLYKKHWWQGYKEVPKPTTGTLPPPQQAGFPNPLAIADAIVPRINPFSFIEDGGDLMSMSPLNFVPGYGKNLSGKNQAFRKFGNSIQDVIDRQALSPKGGSPLRIGKDQIVSEGNWAATDRPWEKYPGVFEATFDFTHPERNIGSQGFKNRSGVLITDRQGNPLPEIPLTEPGMSFNRRLPFSTRYVPIDKQKLMDNKFQLATFAPHLQSLAEKYAVGLGGAATLGAMGYPGAVETYNKYTIDPLKEQWQNFQNSELYKKGKELDQSFGLNFLYDKKKKGGVIEDDMGQWAHPGKITKINSNQITMRGVPYPVLGISDAGDQQMMYPDQEYTFKGKTVTEYPQKKKNGGWLEKYN